MLIFAIVSAVLFVTAIYEERYLQSRLNVSYIKYSREVPRFFPSIHLFSTSSEVTASVAVLKTNFMDGLGSVDIHREAMMAAARCQLAA